MTRRLLCVLCVLTVVLMAATVGRATVITPASVTASNQGELPVANLINNVNFTTAGDVTTWTYAGSGERDWCMADGRNP